MLFSFWTAKAGSGATTVCLALAAMERDGSVLVVDAAGDVPAAVGLAEPEYGLTDWLAAPGSGAEALARLEVPVAPGVDLLPMGGRRRWTSSRVDALVELLARDARTVLVDLGVLDAADPGAPGRLRLRLAADADRSLLVTRPCYLALRRAARLPLRPSGVVLVEEPGRSLTRYDLESVLGVPVVGRVEVDATVARVVDAGMILRRVPRPLARALRGVA